MSSVERSRRSGPVSRLETVDLVVRRWTFYLLEVAPVLLRPNLVDRLWRVVDRLPGLTGAQRAELKRWALATLLH